MCREILPVSVFWYQLPPISCVHERPRCHRMGPMRSRIDYVRRLAKLDATRMDAEYDATPLDLPPGKSEVATRLDLHCRLLCGKSFGAQCGQHLRPRTEAVRWSSTRVCMIDELTATLTATRSTISPSTKIITHNLPPNRNHGGPSRTLRMDLRICECVVMAVLGGLPPGSGPVVSGDSLRIWPRKRVPFI
jgi:hypothetical protein